MSRSAATIAGKLADAMRGRPVEFEPGEAAEAGFFVEDALSEADVLAAEQEPTDDG